MDASRFYEQYFKAVHRQGLQGIGSGLLDRSIERARRRSAAAHASSRVLEVGASSGEHLGFVDPESFGSWTCLDLRPGVSDADLKSALTKQGIQFVTGDVTRLEFDDCEFDEVVSTCLLHHVIDPERALLEMRRVVRPGGRITIGMPTDPGLMNRLVKFLITYPAMRRAQIEDPRLVYAREHVNHVGGLIALVRHVFREDRLELKFWPLGLATWNLNLLVVISVTIAGSLDEGPPT